METLKSSKREIAGLVALYAVLYVVIGFVGTFGGAFVGLLLAIPIVLLSPYYVVFVAIITWYKRHKETVAAKFRPEEADQELIESPAFRFAAKTQTHTFSHNFLLTITGILGIILLYLTRATNNDSDWQDVALWGVGTLAVIGSIYSIIINVGLIYNKKVRAAEQYATRTRTGAWKLILVNRIWSWGIWVTGGAAAVFILFGTGLLY